MPPHEYEEPRLFLKTADGGIIPFDGIQPVNLNADYGSEWITPFSDMPSEMSMTFRITHRSERRMRKLVHAIVRKTERMKRTIARHKEKERRKRLKA